MNKVKKVLVGIFVFVIGTLSKVFANVTYQPDYGVETQQKPEIIISVLKEIVLPIIFLIGGSVIIIKLIKCIKKGLEKSIEKSIKNGKIKTIEKILKIITIILIIAIIVGFYLL